MYNEPAEKKQAENRQEDSEPDTQNCIVSWSDLDETQYAILNPFTEKGIYVRPSIVRALNGNGNAALLLCVLIYESHETADDGGWFECRQDKIKFLTGLGEDGQRKARKLLKCLKPRRASKDQPHIQVLKDRRVGNPAHLEYRLDLGKLAQLLQPETHPRRYKLRLTSSNQDPVHGRHQDPVHGRRDMSGVSPITSSSYLTLKDKDGANAPSNLPRGVRGNTTGGKGTQGSHEYAASTSSRSPKTIPCPVLAEFLNGTRWAWARDDQRLSAEAIIHITRQWLRENVGSRRREDRWESLWRNCVENRAMKNPGWQTAQEPAFFDEAWWPDDSAWTTEEDAEWSSLWNERNELELECALRLCWKEEDGNVERFGLSNEGVEHRLAEVLNEMRAFGVRVAQRLRQPEAELKVVAGASR